MAKRLSPSGFPLLVACAGSFKAQQVYPDESSPAAEEGTLAHEVAATLLHKRDIRGITEYRKITKEMVRAAEMYRDHVFSFGCHPSVDSKKLHIEEKMDIKSLHPTAKGTPDAWFYDEVKNELHVWDFKYGFGPVEVEMNWQLMGYAAGALQLVIKTLTPEKKRDLRIFFHIVQPRARHPDGPIRTWVLHRGNFGIIQSDLKRSIALAHQPDAPFTAGEHCRYCKARLNCAEFKKTSKILSHIPESTELTPGLIGAELSELNRAAKIIDYRITTLADEAKRVLDSGGFVAGFKLKPSFSRDKWGCDEWDLRDAWGQQGLDIPPSILTPAQAKKCGLDITGLTKREFLGDRVVGDKDVIEIDWEGAR